MSGAPDIAVTWATLAWTVGIFLSVSGAAWAVWWRVDARITAAKAEAITMAASAQTSGLYAQTQLAEYKTHVAETYVTKAGMAEQTAQIMHGFDIIGKRLDGLNERLDRVFEVKPASRRSSS